MDLDRVEHIANTLVRTHGLTDWKVSLRSSRFTAGCCSYGTKTITLSKQLMFLWSEAACVDVILHEIAHALAGHAAGHGEEWKAVCRTIGAKPNRCYGQREARADLERAEAAVAGWTSGFRQTVVTRTTAPAVIAANLDTVGSVCDCHQVEKTMTGECAFAA